MDFMRRKYTTGEEVFNSVTHGVGALLAIAGCVILIIRAVLFADAITVVSAAIYGGSLIMLYTMSTLYHAIQPERAKKVFRIFDHGTIYLLIAGTYTPFTLACLRGALGWTLFGIIWGCAILGIVLTSVNLRKFQLFSTICYVAMGWAVIFAIKPLWEKIDTLPLVFLIIGGVLYTGGIIFYLMKESRYMHSIWHLFVVGGSVFHYFSVLLAVT